MINLKNLCSMCSMRSHYIFTVFYLCSAHVLEHENRHNNTADTSLTSKNTTQNPMTSQNTIEHNRKRFDQAEHKEHVLSTLHLVKPQTGVLS